MISRIHVTGLLSLILTTSNVFGASYVNFPFSVPNGLTSFVAALSDVDGDGVVDFVLGTPNTSGDSLRGLATIRSGASREILETLSSPSPVSNGKFGSAVALAGRSRGDSPQLL